MQATEALCHLSVTDIKKTFCNVWFFCENEACVNCGTLNATTLIWLRGKHQVAFGESERKDVNLQFAIHQTVFDVRWCKRGFGSRELGYFIFAMPPSMASGTASKVIRGQYLKLRLWIWITPSRGILLRSMRSIE